MIKLGLGSLFKKSTGLNYLAGEKEEKPNQKKTSQKSQSSNVSYQDEKLLKEMEQTLKKINNQVEDLLERIRVKRRL